MMILVSLQRKKITTSQRNLSPAFQWSEFTKLYIATCMVTILCVCSLYFVLCTLSFFVEFCFHPFPFLMFPFPFLMLPFPFPEACERSFMYLLVSNTYLSPEFVNTSRSQT